MCFTKSSRIVQVKPQDPIIRQEADASLTKNSKSSLNSSSYKENIKTSAFGLEEQAKTQKKTLLGE